MKEPKKDLVDIANQVKDVDENINSIIVPILKDTIEDGNKHNNRIFVLALLELAILIITVLTAMFFIYKQNEKYQEFLSQFEFDTEYVQDLDTTDGGNITNTTIETNK